MWCVCVFFPIYSGRQIRWKYQPGSHRISHSPSFCGACFNFSREKDSAITVLSLVNCVVDFLCNNDSIVLHLLVGHFCFYFFFFSEEKSQLPGFELVFQRVKRLRSYQMSYRGKKGKKKNNSRKKGKKKRKALDGC